MKFVQLLGCVFAFKFTVIYLTEKRRKQFIAKFCHSPKHRLKFLYMPNYSLAEIYFIAVMMILITAGSILAVFFFFRTYKREMNQNRIEKEKKLKEKQEKEYAEK
ncbi:MAG: hypothetical protein ACR2IA_09005 [Pyrinomonadaceae bacterium]